MASAAATPIEVRARVDRGGRLVAADPELEVIQRQAGGSPRGPLALPQLAAISRLAFRLNVPIERPAVLAGAQSDVHCWVRAIPDGDEVALVLENWKEDAARGPRFEAFAAEVVAGPAARPEDLSWSSDGELKLTELSPALSDILGTPREDAIGMPLTKLFRLVEDDDGEMPLINALAARGDFSGQRARSRADDRAELIISGEADLDSEGRLSGYRGKALAEGGHLPSGSTPVQSAPARAGQLVDASFEAVLRVPIERIISEAEQIAGRSNGPLRSDYAGYGADIAAAARHLLSVLSAMGDSPETGRATIDIAALAAEAVVLVEPIAESRQVTIELANTPPIKASGEEHAVIQILVNLLVNALRHSPSGSQVSIRFEARAGWGSVTVSDQGVGIAPQDHSRIFERFERADEEPGGTGLGLAIARRLARSMGGDVSLQSAPGKGADFTLSLPAP